MFKNKYHLIGVFILIAVGCGGSAFAYDSVQKVSYDSLNRLTMVDYGNGQTIAYTYDAAGNRLSQFTRASTSFPLAAPQVVGGVVAWGAGANSSYGGVPVPADLSGVVQVSAGAGSYHTVALKSDGTVLAWGGNWAGQADVPAGLSGVVQVVAGYYFTVALKSDGTVVAWGYNDFGQLGNNSNIVYIR